MNYAKNVVAVVCLLTLIPVLAGGCAETLIGAAGGAVIGAIVGDPATGAAIGALAGAAVGTLRMMSEVECRRIAVGPPAGLYGRYLSDSCGNIYFRDQYGRLWQHSGGLWYLL